MKETILGARQQKAIENELSLKDLVILDYLNRCQVSTRKEHISDNWFTFVRLDYEDLKRDLPILDINKAEFDGILENLIQKDIIFLKTYNNIAYYCLTEPAYDDLYMEPDEDWRRFIND